MEINSYYAGEDLDPPNREDFKKYTFSYRDKTFNGKDLQELFPEYKHIDFENPSLDSKLKAFLVKEGINLDLTFDSVNYQTAMDLHQKELERRTKQFRDDLMAETGELSYEAFRYLHRRIEKENNSEPKDRIYFYLFRIEFNRALDLFKNLTMWNTPAPKLE